MSQLPTFEPAPRRNESAEPRGLRPTPLGLGPLTIALIAGCAVVAYLSKLGANEEFIEHLFITRGLADDAGGMLPEILRGQIWRLLTPIFLHFGIMHLVFNLLWLKDLGTAIERVSGTRSLFGLVLVSGVLSNLGQFAFAGPYFGGMSGVVYALLGYVWMKSHFAPASGYFLPKQTVIIMIGWFFLCMTGKLGHVANYAHGFGLGVGMIWGFVAAKSRPVRGSFAPRD